MNVSVLIVSYNTRDLLLRCVDSALQQSNVGEIVVIDNDSVDGSADAVEDRVPSARVVRMPGNVGFAAGVNRAALEAHGDALLLLNPDAALEHDAVEKLSTLLKVHPRAAAVGPSLRYADGSYQDAAFAFPGLAQVLFDLFPVPRLAGFRLNGRYPTANAPFRVDFTLGACMLVRSAAWRDVGALDEGYFMYVEEVDWCRRAHARGWEIWHHPGAYAIHHGGQSTRKHADAMYLQLWRSRLRYYRKFHGELMNAAIRLLVRAGMRARIRRARRSLAGDQLRSRVQALSEIYQLAR